MEKDASKKLLAALKDLVKEVERSGLHKEDSEEGWPPEYRKELSKAYQKAMKVLSEK